MSGRPPVTAVFFDVRTAFLRRGPWGHLYADDERLAITDLRLAGLAELPDRLPTLHTDRQ